MAAFGEAAPGGQQNTPEENNIPEIKNKPDARQERNQGSGAFNNQASKFQQANKSKIQALGDVTMRNQQQAYDTAQQGVNEAYGTAAGGISKQSQAGALKGMTGASDYDTLASYKFGAKAQASDEDQAALVDRRSALSDVMNKYKGGAAALTGGSKDAMFLQGNQGFQQQLQDTTAAQGLATDKSLERYGLDDLTKFADYQRGREEKALRESSQAALTAEQARVDQEGADADQLKLDDKEADRVANEALYETREGRRALKTEWQALEDSKDTYFDPNEVRKDSQKTNKEMKKAKKKALKNVKQDNIGGQGDGFNTGGF